MKNLTTASIFIASILLTACASQGGWTPTVDAYNDPNAYRINQDMADCKQLASKASAVVEADDAKAAKVASDNRYQLVRSVDADPNNANNAFNILGQKIASGVKKIEAASDGIDAIENESFLDDPLKKIVDTLFILPGLERQKSMATERTEGALKESQALSLTVQQGLQTYAAIGGTATETAIGAGTGALVGAAGGALLGAIAGSPGTGAALGATVGGLGGGAYRGVGAEDKYKSSYNNCMSGRGHKVIR